MRPTRFQTSAILVLLLPALVAGCGSPTDAPSQSANEAATTGTLKFVVEFDEKRKETFELPFAENATLYDVMSAARERGEIRFQTEDFGGSPLVTSLQGIEREGQGTEDRNWLFWHNGAFANVGIGALELESGDVVEWRFLTFTEANAEANAAETENET